ncbi:MAG TPA: hypothetical protein PLQ35_06230 [bacterium]|nr:hypothetical protein [bacterium]HQL61874.1 hypothetical protein [bacterium]
MSTVFRIFWMGFWAGWAVLAVSAHPLSQFSINHFNTLEFRPGSVRIHTLIDIAEMPCFAELGQIDTNNDSQLSREEIAAYLEKRIETIRFAVSLTVDGQEIPLRVDHRDIRFYPGLAKVTCCQILVQFSADFPSAGNAVQVIFRDRSFPENNKNFGQLRLRFLDGATIPLDSIRSAFTGTFEVIPETADTWLLPPADVECSVVPGTAQARTESGMGFPYVDTLVSATIIPVELLQENEAGVIPIFRSNQSQKLPEQTAPVLKPRKVQSFPEPPGSVAPGRASERPEETLAQKSERQMGELIHEKNLSPTFVLFALLLAAFYGAGHALSPGHGKTIVAAYLVGSRGTIWHAFYLGLIVTITHMGSVFIVGIIALNLQSSLVDQGDLVVILEVVSGLLVLGIGFYIFLSRYHEWVRARVYASVGIPYQPYVHHHHEHVVPSPHHHHDEEDEEDHHHGDHSHEHPHEHEHEDHHFHDEDRRVESLAHSYIHPHDHFHSHEHEASHAHAGHTHDHGHHHGHSHEIPANASLWDLLLLGISGGMVPCPTAIIVLIVAIGIGRTAFGLMLIAAFSVGLAVVLITIGVLMVSAKHVLDRFSYSGPVIQILPVFSGALITLIGIWLTLYALQRGGWLVINW